jgi:lipopolysaccharide transport system permease protein
MSDLETMINPSDLAYAGSFPTRRARETSGGRPASEVDAETLIRPRSGWIGLDVRELWRTRELLYFLIWRDVKIRYKQTSLGVAWAVLQPLFTMAIFTVIFGRFAGIPSQGVPYAVFVFAGLIPWTFFANGVVQAGQSLVNQQAMLTKVYFPRLFIPTAAAGAFLVDLLISFGLYAIILAACRIVPSWQIVFLPALIALTVMAVLGAAYTLAALTVLYRDFRYVIPFMIQALMYLSPVIYPAGMLQRYRLLLAINPMCGIIDGYRSAILGTPWDPFALAISSTTAVALFLFGLFYFRKVERLFADIA